MREVYHSKSLLEKPHSIISIKNILRRCVHFSSKKQTTARMYTKWANKTITCACCYWFRCTGTGKRFSNRNETSCLPLVRPRFEPKCLWNPFSSRMNTRSQTDGAIENQVKNLNPIARPYDEWMGCICLTTTHVLRYILAVFHKSGYFNCLCSINELQSPVVLILCGDFVIW